VNANGRCVVTDGEVEALVDCGAVREGALTAVTVNNKSVLLTRWQGKIYAVSGRCPHAGGDMSQGQLHRGRLDCPVHGYRFDVTDGRCLWPPDEGYRLKRYTVLVESPEL
jgi:3-phenylpropionate/trans-cinnamate dioxygenase ferredoxin component